MTIRELIERLEDCDPDATVRIMMQENWPFECAIEGINIRENFSGENCECDHRIIDPHDEGCPAADESYGDDMAPNDVFIVEGQQERYGSKEAWVDVR